MVRYNSDDDYLYINGQKLMYAGIQAHALIPILSGYSSQYGSVNYVLAQSNYPGWQAFDGNDNTIGMASNTASNSNYLGFLFNNKVAIKRVEFLQYNIHSDTFKCTTTVEYYNGSSWVEVPSTANIHTLVADQNMEFTYELDEAIECYGVRINCAFTSGNYIFAMRSMQVYGTEVVA